MARSTDEVVQICHRYTQSGLSFLKTSPFWTQRMISSQELVPTKALEEDDLASFFALQMPLDRCSSRPLKRSEGCSSHG